MPPSFAQVSSDELVSLVPRLASDERHAIVALVAALAEMDARKLHVHEGYSSLFAYCTGRLRLSEPAACRRIEAARASRRYPVILERLAEGTLTLAAVGVLGRHLTPANHVAVLDAAQHRSKRELEEIAARLAPQPDLPSTVRKLPSRQPWNVEATDTGVRVAALATGGEAGVRTTTTAMSFTAVALNPATPLATGAAACGDCPPPPHEPGLQAAPSVPDTMGGAEGEAAFSLLTGDRPGQLQVSPADGFSQTVAPAIGPCFAPPAKRPSIVRPIAPGRYQIQVTVSADAHAKLLRARDLLRHSIPSGDAALILDRALTVLLEHLEKAKFALVAPPVAVHGTGAAERGKRTRRSRARRCRPEPSTTEQPGIQAPSGQRGDPSAAPLAGHSSPTPGVSDVPLSATMPDAPDSPGIGSAPASPSRYIPAAVRREVWMRSGGRCEYVSESGHRCDGRGFLEYHHDVPFAVGGASDASNLRMFCKAHNLREAEGYFGAEFVANRRRAAAGRGEDRSGLLDESLAPCANPTTPAVSPSPAMVDTRREFGTSESTEKPRRGGVSGGSRRDAVMGRPLARETG